MDDGEGMPNRDSLCCFRAFILRMKHSLTHSVGRGLFDNVVVAQMMKKFMGRATKRGRMPLLLDGGRIAERELHYLY